MGITKISVNPLKTLAFSGVMAAFDSKMTAEPKTGITFSYFR